MTIPNIYVRSVVLKEMLALCRLSVTPKAVHYFHWFIVWLANKCIWDGAHKGNKHIWEVRGATRTNMYIWDGVNKCSFLGWGDRRPRPWPNLLFLLPILLSFFAQIFFYLFCFLLYPFCFNYTHFAAHEVMLHKFAAPIPSAILVDLSSCCSHQQ